MVTHRTANFIMLISNLPSVRSSRFKPNVGSRVIRLSLSFPFSFFFHSIVTPCPSFVKYDRRRLLRTYVQPPRRRRRRRLQSSPSYFFFVSTHRHTYSIHSFTLRWKKKRVVPLPLRQLNSCIFFFSLSLLYSSLQ
jgi:hypothetical protein